MEQFTVKAREYLETIPGDSVQKALAACNEYVYKVFEHECYKQMNVLCTDRESRQNWQSQLEMLDNFRHNAHENLMNAIRTANAQIRKLGMKPLFPVDNDADRTKFGDVAIMVVNSYFNERK